MLTLVEAHQGRLHFYYSGGFFVVVVISRSLGFFCFWFFLSIPISLLSLSFYFCVLSIFLSCRVLSILIVVVFNSQSNNPNYLAMPDSDACSSDCVFGFGMTCTLFLVAGDVLQGKSNCRKWA